MPSILRNMAKETDNLILEHLRAIQAKLDDHDSRFASIDTIRWFDSE